jgi:hypothetical protein
MSDDSYVVLTYGLNDFERGQIHQLMKSNSEHWWHQYPDVWIVKGGTSGDFWRDLVIPVLPQRGRGSVLVMKLRGNWAAFGSHEQFDWLMEMLPGTVRQDESEAPEPATGIRGGGSVKRLGRRPESR